jgi:hypothetical protein
MAREIGYGDKACYPGDDNGQQQSPVAPGDGGEGGIQCNAVVNQTE